MKVGTFCFATERGLGYLAKSFYDHGVVTDAVVVHHGSIKTHTEWYPKAYRVTNLNSPKQKEAMRNFCDGMDAMLFFETPFYWGALDHCRQKGIPTFLVTMYECTPNPVPSEPDIYVCPSLLDLDYFPSSRSVFLPVPTEVEWKQRTRALNFVHNAGYLGLRGRNGTQELLTAIPHIKSPISLTIRSQSSKLNSLVNTHAPSARNDPRVTIKVEHIPHNELRDGYDVCIAPERFNGMSYPLQEARASGMLVMTTNRFPANSWLPMDPMIPVHDVTKGRINSRFNWVEECILDPEAIARTIDEWYGKDISDYSLSGKRWAEENSWEALKPRWMEVLSNGVTK